jgi:endoglycosylceramidase
VPRAALLVLTLALLVAPAAAQAQQPLPRLQVERGGDPAIVDAQGREVLLRGINVNQLGDYFQADPKQRTVFPLTDEDFAGIARLGFNVVRLVTNWSAWQPQRGSFDSAYLARVRAAVDAAARHGMYVVIDMHQDAWGKFVATKPGTACPPGLGPSVGWDGAPEWATLTDGMSTCRAADTRELSPAVAQAFQSFYLDREGIQSELVATWGRIARAFAGDARVAGFDLLNEPHPGFLVGPDQSAALGRFYGAAIEAIRAGEKAGGGFPHVVFFEPSVVWSGFGDDAVPPPGFTDDEHIVFAPHLYAESITVDQKLGITSVSIERGFANAERTAALYRAPLWSGEWGWFGEPAKELPELERYAREEDRAAIGGAFWVWRQACGDPHTVGYTGAAGALNRLQCPGDRDLGLNTTFTRVLSRAYPRFAPGRITALTSRDATFALGGTRGGGDCRVEVWVPGDREPELSGRNVSGLATRRVDGGWVATGCAGRGAYALSGKPGEPAAGGSPVRRGARRCRSRRVIAINLRVPRRVRLRSVRTRAQNATIRRSGRDLRRIVVDARNRPRVRVVVQVTAIARDGTRYSERRAYRTCVPS